MTFPTATETGGTNAASTSHDLSLPAFDAGDLIIVKAETPSNPTHTWTFDAATDKFTQLWSQDTSVSVSREVCKYRIMQAGDGSTLTIGLGSSRALTYSIIKVTGWHGTQAPECATAAAGYSNNIDPPSVTASWGSGDNLFIACCMTQDRAITVATPGDYTAFDNHGSDANGYERQAYRQLASDTSNPGNFTATGNSRYVTNTIVVRPVEPSKARSYGYITT